MDAVDSYIIKCVIAVFSLSIYLFYLHVTTEKIGINLACTVGVCG